MKFRRLILTVLCVCLIKPLLAQAPGPRRAVPSGKPTYNQLISAGYDLIATGKPKPAYVAAMEAAKTDPKRFESYALAALVMHVQGADADAQDFVEKALGLAPADKKPKLRELAKAINDGMTAPTVAATTNTPIAPSNSSIIIGSVDAQRVANESRLGKSYFAQVADVRARYQADIDVRTKQITEAQEKLRVSQSVLSDAGRRQLTEGIAALKTEVEGITASRDRESAALQQRLSDQFGTQLVPVVTRVAQAKNTKVVYSDGTMAYRATGVEVVDLTADVIRALDSVTK